MLAFPDVIDLLSHELAGLGGRDFPSRASFRARSIVFFSGIGPPDGSRSPEQWSALVWRTVVWITRLGARSGSSNAGVLSSDRDRPVVLLRHKKRSASAESTGPLVQAPQQPSLCCPVGILRGVCPFASGSGQALSEVEGLRYDDMVRV